MCKWAPFTLPINLYQLLQLSLNRVCKCASNIVFQFNLEIGTSVNNKTVNNKYYLLSHFPLCSSRLFTIHLFFPHKNIYGLFQETQFNPILPSQRVRRTIRFFIKDVNSYQIALSNKIMILILSMSPGSSGLLFYMQVFC